MSKISWSIVRPIVTLAMVGAFIWGFAVGKITPEDFKLLAAVTITWWYTSRDAVKAAEKLIIPAAEPPKEPTK